MLKPGGPIAYFTIFVAEDLSQEERRTIGKAMPAGVYTPALQRDLARTAGFVRIQQTDVTDEFERVSRAVYEANERHASSLRRALGVKPFQEAQEGRRKTLQRIEAGILKRALFVARRP